MGNQAALKSTRKFSPKIMHLYMVLYCTAIESWALPDKNKNITLKPP